MWDKGKIILETDYQPNDEYNNIQNGCHKILEISWNGTNSFSSKLVVAKQWRINPMLIMKFTASIRQ